LLIVVSVRFAYQCWTDPLPLGYAERLRNEPRFGRKIWHKFALGFLVTFALLVVAVEVGLLG
jgi:hypothetical protein